MVAPTTPPSLRFRDVNETVVVVLGLLIITALAIVPQTLIIIHHRESDALVIDLAGRQRMLLERHMKEVLLASAGVEADYRQTRGTLKDGVEILIHGGSTVARLDRDARFAIPPAPTERIKEELSELQRRMTSLFADADAYLLQTPAAHRSEAARDALLADHAALLALANQVVVLLTRHSEQNVRTLIQWEVAVVLLVVAGAALATWRFLRAEQALKESQAMTEQALRQRDEVKTSLLSSVSHELRTPLTAIKTMVFSLRHDSEREPSTLRWEFLTAIDRELDYLNGLVGNLLDMSRLDAGTLRPRREWHVLEELVEAALRRVEPLLTGRPLNVRLAPDIPALFVDGVQLQQVLVNLLENAVKFSPADSPIWITAHLSDGTLELAVTNEGPGVPGHELEKIFDRFYRVRSEHSPATPGTGLGLAICKGIIEAHGGTMTARSTPGRETTILFHIPTATPPAVGMTAGPSVMEHVS
jgi:two-component system, OmpR family, sensor histidine kinase KdpD